MSKMITREALREQISNIAYSGCDVHILDKACNILHGILGTAKNEKHAFNMYRDEWIAFIYTDSGINNGFGDSEGFSVPASIMEKYLPFEIDYGLFRYGKRSV